MNITRLFKSLFVAMLYALVASVIVIILLGTTKVIIMYVPSPWDIYVIVFMCFVGMVTWLRYDHPSHTNEDKQ